MPRSRLWKVSVENYLSFRKAEVELQPLSVLVGPNGAGKSNFLDVIRFVGDVARYDISGAFDRRGGFDQVRLHHQLALRNSIKITIEASATAHSSSAARDIYSLTVTRANRGPSKTFRRTEEFKFKRMKGRGRRLTLKGQSLEVFAADEGNDRLQATSLDTQSSILSVLPRLPEAEGGREVKRFGEFLKSFTVFDVDVAAARRPGATSNRDLPESLASNASNLASFLQGHRKTETLDLIERDLAKVIPGFLGFGFRRIGGSTEQVVVSLRERGLNQETDLAFASYGTIRLLALLALCHDDDAPPIVGIEEIDHGVHPAVLDLLVDRLNQASERTQFIVATHSPALVNRLRADQLLVAERSEEGLTRLPAVSSRRVMELESEMGGEVRLGELWFSGWLGGMV